MFSKGISFTFSFAAFMCCGSAYAEKLGASATRAQEARARIVVEVYKDPSQALQEAGLSKQFMTVKENGRLVLADIVSTGEEGRPGPKDISVETASGVYSFELLDTPDDGKNVFRNDDPSIAGFHPDYAAIFQVKNVFGKTFMQAIHDSARVTGKRASHGCIRANKSRKLVKLLKDYGLDTGILYIYGHEQPELSQADIAAIKGLL